MDLEECLLSKHNMEVYSVIRNRGNSIQAKYEIGCMPGFSPNMEGTQTTTVACNRQKDDLTKEGFIFRINITWAVRAEIQMNSIWNHINT